MVVILYVKKGHVFQTGMIMNELKFPELFNKISERTQCINLKQN